MAEKEKERLGINLELTPAAASMVRSLKADSGMVQKLAIERILEWFTRQPADFQKAILSADEAGSKRLLLQSLHTLLAEDNVVGTLEFEKTVGTMKEMLSRIATDHRVAVQIAREHSKKK